MNEESWSIRKMREQQKLSKTRNTYKQSTVYEINKEPLKEEKQSMPLYKYLTDGLNGFYQKIQVILEEE